MEEEIVKNAETINAETVKFNKVPSIVMIIVSFFVGGLIGVGFSIASLVVGSKVEELCLTGNVEEAKRKLKTAKGLLVVSYIWDGLMALVFVGLILIMVGGTLASIQI